LKCFDKQLSLTSIVCALDQLFHQRVLDPSLRFIN